MKNYQRETITPSDKEHWLQLRSKNINSTEITALFPELQDECRFHTPASLWHEKKNGVVVELEENKAMRRGKKMEPVIAELLAEDNNWTISPLKDYMQIQELRLGSSFDYKIGEGQLLEIKSVNWKQRANWIKNSEIQAPAYVEMQFQHQLLVSGIEEGYLGVMFSIDDWVAIHRKANPQIQEMIINRSKEFWDSVSSGTAPAWDFESKLDREAIKALYAKPEEGKSMECHAELEALMEQYLEASKEISFLTQTKEALGAQIRDTMKDCETATGQKFKASCKLIKKGEYMVKASESRQLRVSEIGCGK